MRIAPAIAATALVLGLGAPPAGAQVVGPCSATIAGQDVRTATRPVDAIEVDDGATVIVEGVDNTGAPYSRIQLRFPPLPNVTVHDDDYGSAQPTWSGTVEVSDYATWGVGLYQVSGVTDDCKGTAWIRVTGKSPMTTVAGGVAAALTGVGLAAAARSVVRARPSFGSLLRSLGAGVPLGVGAAVLAQQFALTPLTGATVAAWTVGSAAASGLGNVAVAAARGGAAIATA